MKWLVWGCLIVATLALGYGILFAAPAATATAADGTKVIFLPDWVGLTGIAALLGVAIQWGQWKRTVHEQDREILKLREGMEEAMPRADFEQRLNRFEDRIEQRLNLNEKKLQETVEEFFRRFGLERRRDPRAEEG